jgi:hypothetical protein
MYVLHLCLRFILALYIFVYSIYRASVQSCLSTLPGFEMILILFFFISFQYVLRIIFTRTEIES